MHATVVTGLLPQAGRLKPSRAGSQAYMVGAASRVVDGSSQRRRHPPLVPHLLRRSAAPHVHLHATTCSRGTAAACNRPLSIDACSRRSNLPGLHASAPGENLTHVLSMRAAAPLRATLSLCGSTATCCIALTLGHRKGLAEGKVNGEPAEHAWGVSLRKDAEVDVAIELGIKVAS
jgi:hypothetical protein